MRAQLLALDKRHVAVHIGAARPSLSNVTNRHVEEERCKDSGKNPLHRRLAERRPPGILGKLESETYQSIITQNLST